MLMNESVYLQSVTPVSSHYNNVIMRAIASQITSLTIVYSTVYSSRRSKKTSMLRVTGLCVGNSPGTGEFPAQIASYAENVSIWWRHHAYLGVVLYSDAQTRMHTYASTHARIHIYVHKFYAAMSWGKNNFRWYEYDWDTVTRLNTPTTHDKCPVYEFPYWCSPKLNQHRISWT